MKKTLAVLLALVMALAMAVPAFSALIIDVSALKVDDLTLPKAGEMLDYNYTVLGSANIIRKAYYSINGVSYFEGAQPAGGVKAGDVISASLKLTPTNGYSFPSTHSDIPWADPTGKPELKYATSDGGTWILAFSGYVVPAGPVTAVEVENLTKPSVGYLDSTVTASITGVNSTASVVYKVKRLPLSGHSKMWTTISTDKASELEKDEDIRGLVTVKLADGNTFGENPKATWDALESISAVVNTENAAECTFTFSTKVRDELAAKPIDKAVILIPEPVVGEVPATKTTPRRASVHSFILEPFTVKEVVWIPNDSEFAPGVNYVLNVVLEAKSGRIFPNDAIATVNGEEALAVPLFGQAIRVVYEFGEPKAASVNEIVFTDLDAPNGKDPLDTTASTTTTGVTINSVSYTKGSLAVTEAAPGDELKVLVEFTLTGGATLADDATAKWGDVECEKAYDGGTKRFLAVGPDKYRCQFAYTVPAAVAIKDVVITDLDAPNGKDPLDTAASTSTEGVTVTSVTYTKGGSAVTSAAPGDALKINVFLPWPPM